MASNHTSNFGLNQWAAEDTVLREDFNADNAKIDAALASGLEVITGTYTGTGTLSTIHYTLGKRPQFLLLLTGNSGNAGFSLLIVTQPYYLRLQKNGSNGVFTNDYVTFTDDGFTIDHSKYQLNIGFNDSNCVTCYCAFC